MRKVVALITVIVFVLQALTFSAFAEPTDAGGFKPAIDVNEGMVKTKISEEEIQRLYSEFKSKVEKDRANQKEMISQYKKEEKVTIENEKKKYLEQIGKDTGSKSLTDSSLLLSATSPQMTSVLSNEIVNAPYDLDAEVINATVDGGHLILTWMPSEDADGYNIYHNDGTSPFNKVCTVTTEKYEMNITNTNNFFVRAYKNTESGQVESSDSNTITVICGDKDISSSMTLQNNYVYARNLNVIDGTLDLNGKMLKVYGCFNQKNTSEVNLNGGKLITMDSYTIENSSKLKMLNANDYIYAKVGFYFDTSEIHNDSYLNNGIIQVVGSIFQVKKVNTFQPDGSHKVYLNGLDLAGETTITFIGGDTLSKFKYLGINKPLTKYRFIPSERAVSTFFHDLIQLENNERYFGVDGIYTPTGSFGRSYTDMVITGVGLDMEIGRTYNSKNKKDGMLGNGWTFSYEGSVEVSNGVAGVYIPDGSVFNFTEYSPSPTPTPSVTPSPAQTPTKVYKGEDSRSELSYFQGSDSFELTFKDRTRYGYNKINNKYLLSYIKDYCGNTVTIGHLSNGNINTISDQTGRTIQISYPSSTEIVATDTVTGRTIVYTLDGYGKLQIVEDANGNEIYEYGYYANDGALEYVKLTEKLENGSKVQHNIDLIEYNDDGRITKHTDMYGKVSNFTYKPGETITVSEINGDTRTIVDRFDQNYSINEIVENDGTSTVIEYFTEEVEVGFFVNKYSEIKSKTDIYGNKTTYERDSYGNITKTINPDGSEKEYGYYTDAARLNLLKWEKDEEGSYTYYNYNNSRLLEEKYVYRTKVTTSPFPELASLNSTNSYITTYGFRTDGQIEYMIEPGYYSTVNSGNEVKTSYSYNTDGMLQSITDPENNSVEYTYNSSRLIESEKILLNGYTTYMSTWYEYDNNGKLERKTLCDSDSLSTAGNKSIERYVYDLAGRLIQKITPNLYNSTYDNIASHTYSDTMVGYRYEYKNGTTLVTKETDAEGNVTDYTYDENGNLLTRTEPDLDPSFEVGSIPERTIYSYEYDSKDRIIKVSATPYGEAEITLEFYEYLSPEHISQNNYYSIVNHTTILNTTEGLSETIKYDYAGRLVESVKEPGTGQIETSTEYNHDGTVKSTTDGEGFTTYSFYDTRKKPVHIWIPCEGSNGVASFYTYKRMVYDDSGNLVNEAVKIDKVSSSAFASNRETIQSSSIDTGFYKSTNEYYRNNKLKTSTGMTGEKKTYYYDGAGNINKIEEYKDDTDKITTEYTNNYLGKPAFEKLYVQEGDIYGYSYTSTGTYTVSKYNSYDKNGNKTSSNEPIYMRMEFYSYDNMDRLVGQSTSGYYGNYSETTSWTLNAHGSPLAKTDARGLTTEYGYDWRGLNRKIIDTVTVYDEASDSYAEKKSITMNWYDYAGRKIGDVSPNNYRESMEVVTFPYLAPSYICSNYNYYTYDEFGRIIRSGFDGEEYEYNSTSSTWSASHVDTYKQYTYDNNNNLLTETDQQSNVTEYKYTPQGKLLSKLDHENKQRYLPYTVKYEYDALGRVITEKTVKSDTTQEEAAIAAQIAAGTLPAGSTIDESSAVGAIVTYDYDNILQGSIIKANKVTKTVNLTDNNGVVEKSTYDLKGNLIEYTSCKGGTEYTSTYEYNNFGKLSKAVEPYEVDGTLTSTQKIMQYNSLGNMVYVQNMMNTLADTSDDICDLYSYNVVSSKVETQCRQRYNGNEAITTRASYDKNGNTVSTTDGNSVQTTYQYDELDRMKLSTVTAGSAVHDTTYDYDLNGNLIRTTDWRDNSYKYKYDALNRLYEKTDPMNVAYEKLEYNARNLQDKSYDAYNKLTEHAYDGNGRLVSTTDPELHTVSQEYDNMGNMRVKHDGEENELKYEYDILGRLEHVYNDDSTTTPMSSYTYYIDGTLKEQNLEGYVTTYYYNASGKLKRVCDPNGIGVAAKTETYEYTPTGELMKKLDRNGKHTTYAYDCHGRMINQFTGDTGTYVKITVPNEATDMGYDGNGNLKKIIVETKENGVLKSKVTTQRTYDELNRVKTKTETSVDASNNTIVMGPVTYNYDIITGVNAGEIKEQSVYPGSNSVDKVYDVAGRLKTVTSDGQTTIYDYYDDGRRESVTHNNNFRQVYTYYDDGLLDTLTNEVKNSQGVFAESEYYKYYYDGAHNMTQKQERVRGTTKTTSYGYDCMNRLENIYEPDINTAQRTIAYTYDSRGNRDTEIETITATSEVTYTKYEYTDNNRIQYVTKREDNQYGNILQRKQYVHDNNGNLTNVYNVTNGQSTITTNTYTLLNQLKTTVTTGIDQQMENTYNAEGKRVAKTVGGTTARYFYEYDSVAFEYTNSGTISAFNVIGTGLISRKTGTDKVYYFYNGHADVTALLDATTKNIRSQYKYDEFGNISSETYYDSNGVATTDEEQIIRSQILYSGYQYDKESKYYNLHARYYDPQTARFLQQDTYMGSAGDPLSLNLYTYCHNEPMMYFDPSGHDAVWIRDMATKYHFGVDWEEKSKSAILTSPTGFKFVFTTTIIDGKMYIDEDHFLYATGLKAPSSFNDVIAATRKTQAITKSSVTKNQTNNINVNKGTGNAYTLSGSSNEEKIWNYLTQYRKLSKIAAAGVMANIKVESGFDPFKGEVGGGGGWGLIQWTPAKNIEIAAPKEGMYAGATSGNVDDYLLWELDALWKRGGDSFWENMNKETSVGSYKNPPEAKSAGGTQFNGNYKGEGSAYYFHAVIERSGDMNNGLNAKGVPNGSQKYNGSWHGNILLRPYYAEQILAKYK